MHSADGPEQKFPHKAKIFMSEHQDLQEPQWSTRKTKANKVISRSLMQKVLRAQNRDRSITI